ncbi:ATP-binding domain-containing protein, partial [Myxococcota bacterium]
QDCKGGEIAVLAGLQKQAACLCAADAFQDLSGDDECEAMKWAGSVGEVITLTDIHRTDKAGLLDAAHALRNGEPLTNNRAAGFEVLPVPRAPVGGAVACWRIRSWSQHGEIVLISPTARATSPFCRAVVEWTSTKKSKAKTGATAGPYSIAWEQKDEDACEAAMAALGLPVPQEEGACIPCTELADAARGAGLPDVLNWTRRVRFVQGRESVSHEEAAQQIRELVRRRRAFSQRKEGRRVALTIHQAKNREFESVIVLWPLKIQPGDERQRRLLYNAVTRARRQAVVLVQDPKKNRLDSALFAGVAGAK